MYWTVFRGVAAFPLGMEPHPTTPAAPLFFSPSERPQFTTRSSCALVPEIENQRRLFDLPIKQTHHAGGKFNLDIRMMIEPFIDGVVHILQPLFAEPTVKRPHARRPV